jgi:hypothetical protein
LDQAVSLTAAGALSGGFLGDAHRTDFPRKPNWNEKETLCL